MVVAQATRPNSAIAAPPLTMRARRTNTVSPDFMRTVPSTLLAHTQLEHQAMANLWPPAVDQKAGRPARVALPPIWFMLQAGRYLPAFGLIKKPALPPSRIVRPSVL